MKRKTYLIIIIISFFAIVATFSILIFSISRIDKKTESFDMGILENEINSNIISTNFSEIRISPNATITKICNYKKCGHTITSTDSVSDSLVNISEEDFKRIYSDWNIADFSSTSIKIEKTFDSNCDDHFLVKDLNGYISIYRIKDDDCFELLETTGIATKYLSQIDMNELENGVTLYGKEKLNAYIENFE